MRDLLPFTYEKIVKSLLIKDGKTILDVGCGYGELMAYLNRDSKYEITGIDLYERSLEKAYATGAYAAVKKMDIRKPKFKENSFDIVICSMVIEHITRPEGLKLIKNLERIAKKQVVISTSVGYMPYDRLEGHDDDNPYEVHKSGWSVNEMLKRGYRVYGQGADFVYGKHRLMPFLRSRLTKNMLFGLSYLLSPLWYVYPPVAAHMICSKEAHAFSWRGHRH
jgi:ubiquinone/menaquinone biosynthesis C-methylase UbiE